MMLKLAGLVGILAIASCGVLAPMAAVSANEITGLSQGVVWDQRDDAKPELTITPTAIGPARLGMTLGELRQSVGELTIGEPEPWMVDFDALPVLDGGTVLFYVVYENWQPMADSDTIEILMTENPEIETPEGIGAGSTIAEAEAVYGTPTLGYNVETHSREVLQFADLPWSDYSFEPKVLAGEDFFAGIYDASEDRSYQETNAYRDDAVIGSILIDTRGQ